MKRFRLVALLALALAVPRPIFAAAGVAMTVTGPKQVSVGQEFTVAVQMNGAVEIDTVRAIGTFSSGLLEWRGIRPAGAFTNVSPGNSVDAAAGTFSFGTFTFEKYANGSSNVAVITLKARKTGTAVIQLTPDSLAYSAGEGSVRSVGELRITIGEAAPVTVPPPVKALGITAPAGAQAIVLTSSSHPDSNAWYANNVVQVSWQIAKPVQEVFATFDQSPDANAYSPVAGTSATFTATRDGQWYVHLAVAFQDKTFGRADFPVRVDRTPPRPVAPVVDRAIAAPSDANAVRFATTDDASGIAAYELSIDGSFVTSTLLNAYPLTGLSAGNHEIVVRAVDRAGNFVVGTTRVQILGRLMTGLLFGARDVVILSGSVFFGILVLLLLFLRRKRQKVQ